MFPINLNSLKLPSIGGYLSWRIRFKYLRRTTQATKYSSLSLFVHYFARACQVAREISSLNSPGQRISARRRFRKVADSPLIITSPVPRITYTGRIYISRGTGNRFRNISRARGCDHGNIIKKRIIHWSTLGRRRNLRPRGTCPRPKTRDSVSFGTKRNGGCDWSGFPRIYIVDRIRAFPVVEKIFNDSEKGPNH